MNPVQLLVKIISDHSQASKWSGAPLESFRHVANTNRGQIGEDFIRRYLAANGINIGNGSRVTPTDLMISGRRFEVKTASEDVNGCFQFNHIRLDRPYDYLLCLGIAPSSIWFGVWRKGVVAEEGAGKLVRMAEGQSVTFKLTKKQDSLQPIEQLPVVIEEIINDR